MKVERAFETASQETDDVMANPKITATSFFENIQWFALPEALIILRNGLGSDRIQRIQYSEISRIAAGRAFPTILFFTTLAAVLLFGWIMVASELHPVGVIFFSVAVGIWIKVLVSKKSLIVVESLGGVFRITKYLLTRKKLNRFVDALLEHTETAQMVPPKPEQESATETDEVDASFV